jgi:MoaA/NifB/PqqE/SkfB family radical SAM enzyme
VVSLERVSIEVTNRCAKACDFCYSHSLPGGATRWTSDELVAFASDRAANGVKALSFGGGGPLQHDRIFEVLGRLRGVLFRSMTTNGLLLSNGRSTGWSGRPLTRFTSQSTSPTPRPR